MEGSEGFGLDPEVVRSRSGWELRSTGLSAEGLVYWRRLGPGREIVRVGGAEGLNCGQSWLWR